jgi:hypothetical protein
MPLKKNVPAPTPVKIGFLKRPVPVIQNVEDKIDAPRSESLLVA